MHIVTSSKASVHRTSVTEEFDWAENSPSGLSIKEHAEAELVLQPSIFSIISTCQQQNQRNS